MKSIKIVNNETVNCLSLTTMVENGIINRFIVEPYEWYRKNGELKFFFEVDGGEVFAIMESKNPLNLFKERVKANSNISSLVFMFRFNTRKDKTQERFDVVLSGISNTRLTYNKLTGNE